MQRLSTLLTLVALLSLQTGGAGLAQQKEMISDPKLFSLLRTGQELMQQNKFEEACKVFRQVLEINPHIKGAQIDLGGSLLKLGRYDEAQAILIQATREFPDTPEAWLDLGTSYQSTGKIPDSIICLRRFLKLAPHHEYAPKVQSMITLLEQDQKMHGNVKGNDQGEDYLADAVQSGTIRFAKERMPLRIYLAPGSGVPGYKPAYDEIVRKAFADWQATAPDYLSFKYVESSTDADITVTWTNDPSKMISSAEGGHAEVVPTPNGILKSDITLLTTRAGTGEEAGPNHLRHVVLHEVGHALGIFGHSPKAGDIMYGIVMPTDAESNLSERDKHTMLALYSATGSEVHPMDSSKMIIQGDSSSPAMKLIKLNKEAGQAMAAGNFTEAQSKFEQALKIDPGNFMLKQNLAALYANLGSVSFMKRDFAGAEAYFKKSIPILQQSPDKTNLKKVLPAYQAVLMAEGKQAEAQKLEAQLKAIK